MCFVLNVLPVIIEYGSISSVPGDLAIRLFFKVPAWFSGSSHFLAFQAIFYHFAAAHCSLITSIKIFAIRSPFPVPDQFQASQH
jgi:hypothetical protein